MKILNKENFLENSFKGIISYETQSEERDYPYYSTQNEPFFSLLIDIKGTKTLDQALDNYVKYEILDKDDKDEKKDNRIISEKYKRKIKAKRNCSLKKLGNFVIIRLKRYDFVQKDNGQIYERKIDDYFTFPKEINFKRWTRAYLHSKDSNNNEEMEISDEEKRNLEDNYVDYVLTGVSISQGKISQGHYYSFIMDQKSRDWYKFDDEKVEKFDIENEKKKEFENDCFGDYEYNKSAYLLFYTKKSLLKQEGTIQNINNNNEEVLQNIKKKKMSFI